METFKEGSPTYWWFSIQIRKFPFVKNYPSFTDFSLLTTDCWLPSFFFFCFYYQVQSSTDWPKICFLKTEKQRSFCLARQMEVEKLKLPCLQLHSISRSGSWQAVLMIIIDPESPGLFQSKNSKNFRLNLASDLRTGEEGRLSLVFPCSIQPSHSTLTA